MVQNDVFSIVRGANFSIVQGAIFSIVRGAVFNIVRGAVFSIVWVDVFSIGRGDAFVVILDRLLGPRWRCSADRSEVLGKAWGWWCLCGELKVLRQGLMMVAFWNKLNSWLYGIAWMSLCAVSSDRITWPHHYKFFLSRRRAPTSM